MLQYICHHLVLRILHDIDINDLLSVLQQNSAIRT